MTQLYHFIIIASLCIKIHITTCTHPRYTSISIPDVFMARHVNYIVRTCLAELHHQQGILDY